MMLLYTANVLSCKVVSMSKKSAENAIPHMLATLPTYNISPQAPLYLSFLMKCQDQFLADLHGKIQQWSKVRRLLRRGFTLHLSAPMRQQHTGVSACICASVCLATRLVRQSYMYTSIYTNTNVCIYTLYWVCDTSQHCAVQLPLTTSHNIKHVTIHV